MQKLYVAMVGLPARGKSTLAKRIRDGLMTEGIAARLFNNGDMRRALIGAESTDPNFYDPNNKLGREAREMICMRNMEQAREWLAREGEVAILDATNVSRARRHLIETTLTDHPVLFVECVNEDQLLLNACIRRKTTLPEYASYTEEEALASFMKRISYYDTIYEPLQDEKYWLRVDSTANRILDERPCESSPYYPAIREMVVSVWIQCLYLARHGQTEFNLRGRIGGDPRSRPLAAPRLRRWQPTCATNPLSGSLHQRAYARTKQPPPCLPNGPMPTPWPLRNLTKYGQAIARACYTAKYASICPK